MGLDIGVLGYWGIGTQRQRGEAGESQLLKNQEFFSTGRFLPAIHSLHEPGNNLAP